jgi:hypothetical protein
VTATAVATEIAVVEVVATPTTTSAKLTGILYHYHPILSYTILYYAMLSYPILSYPIQSYPILSHPIISYPILSHPIISYPILCYPTITILHPLSPTPCRPLSPPCRRRISLDSSSPSPVARPSCHTHTHTHTHTEGDRSRRSIRELFRMWQYDSILYG